MTDDQVDTLIWQLEGVEKEVASKVAVEIRAACPEHIANYIVGNMDMIAAILEPIIYISNAVDRIYKQVYEND